MKKIVMGAVGVSALTAVAAASFLKVEEIKETAQPQISAADRCAAEAARVLDPGKTTGNVVLDASTAEAISAGEKFSECLHTAYAQQGLKDPAFVVSFNNKHYGISLK